MVPKVEPSLPGTADMIDKQQLVSMQLRLVAGVGAFLGLCGLASMGAACISWTLVQHQPSLLWLVLAVPVLSELLFAVAWHLKLAKLNSQPLPRHAPYTPDFDPAASYDRFIVEQHKTSKWICIKAMLSKWFGGVDCSHICRGNVAELVCYGFFYMSREEYEATYQRPSEQLVLELEDAWGVQFKPGYNPELSYMAHLWQPIRCHYRPLAFYLGIEFMFAFKHVAMLSMGFKSSSVMGFTYYTFNINAPDAQDKVPILFQHGVGVGILPYMLFIARMAAAGHPLAAMECSHLGMRWVPHVPDADEVVEALTCLITKRLRWRRVCVSGHSYGTFYASRLLQLHPHLVHSLCLVDPVTFNMFTGKLISNFVYQPEASSLITWFIARDIHSAASVCRNFFWSQLNLWPDQLPARTLVVLSEADELVPVKETVQMLIHEAPHAQVLHHPNHFHADFIKDLPWQRQVVASLVTMLQHEHEPVPAVHRRQLSPAGQAGDRAGSVESSKPVAAMSKAAQKRRRRSQVELLALAGAVVDSSTKQVHKHSDSADSYDSIVHRLRPRQHRLVA